MSATQGIKKLLENGEAISPVEAFAVFGVIRLGGIIFKLRKDGMLIETEMRKDSAGHTYARYSLSTVEDKLFKTKELIGKKFITLQHDYFEKGEEVTLEEVEGSSEWLEGCDDGSIDYYVNSKGVGWWMNSTEVELVKETKS